MHVRLELLGHFTTFQVIPSMSLVLYERKLLHNKCKYHNSSVRSVKILKHTVDLHDPAKMCVWYVINSHHLPLQLACSLQHTADSA